MTYLDSLRVHLTGAVKVLDAYAESKDAPVSVEQLAEDVIDACALEGWDTTLLFWDDGRYDDDDNEVPSEIAANIARRLLERYDMKARI